MWVVLSFMGLQWVPYYPTPSLCSTRRRGTWYPCCRHRRGGGACPWCRSSSRNGGRSWSLWQQKSTVGGGGTTAATVSSGRRRTGGPRASRARRVGGFEMDDFTHSTPIPSKYEQFTRRAGARGGPGIHLLFFQKRRLRMGF